MKKVLAIAPYAYLPYFSGGQKSIAIFFEYLGKEIDLSVISVAENNFALAKNYKTIPLFKKSFSRYFDRSLIRKVVTLTKQEGFDTIICEHPYLAWLAFAVRKQTGVKVIIRIHNIEYQRFRSTGRWWWPLLKSYEKRCMKKADALFFVSPDDRSFASNEWEIPAEKCIDIPFGVEISSYPQTREVNKQAIIQQYNIPNSAKILLFTGLLNYKPNLDALKIILDKINPLLLSHSTFQYKIIICGKGLPEEMNSLKEYVDKNIVFAGFVDSIEPYLKAADIFLNPVQSGGGVKTKIVEAIAYGTTVISTESGATGIVKNICGNKLVVVNDDNWEEFVREIIGNAHCSEKTPQAYYNNYYYGNIVRRLIEAS